MLQASKVLHLVFLPRIKLKFPEQGIDGAEQKWLKQEFFNLSMVLTFETAAIVWRICFKANYSVFSPWLFYPILPYTYKQTQKEIILKMNIF